MATSKHFPQAAFLSYLETFDAAALRRAEPAWSPQLTRILWPPDGEEKPSSAAAAGLLQLLQARAAVLQAATDAERVADALRRYQKFAKPGRPSPHIVGLRQQQAAARQDASRSRQAFVHAAAGFVREAAIKVPPRVPLEAFITQWIEVNVPVAAIV